MSPEKARVFAVENDDEDFRILESVLQIAGHTIVVRARSVEEVSNVIDKLVRLDIQIATIDGNLSPEGGTGEDGEVIVKSIQERTPQIKTVGMGSNDVKGADVNVTKLGYHVLGKVVTDL